MTPEVVERIEADLRQEWSPEQIAGRLAGQGGFQLSPERIYQHIRADRQAGGTLYRHLRHHQKKRKNAMANPMPAGRLKSGPVSISGRRSLRKKAGSVTGKLTW